MRPNPNLAPGWGPGDANPGDVNVLGVLSVIGAFGLGLDGQMGL